MKKQLLRRTTAIILALCMLMGMVPVGYAADMPLYEVTLAPGTTYAELIVQIDEITGDTNYLTNVEYGYYTIIVQISPENTIYITDSNFQSVAQIPEGKYSVRVTNDNGSVTYGTFWLKVIAVHYVTTNITYGSGVPDTVTEIEMTVHEEKTATIPKATESVSYEDGTTVELRIPVVDGYTPVVKYNNTEVAMEQDVENTDDYVGKITVDGEHTLHIDYVAQPSQKTIELYINGEKIQSITEYVDKSLSTYNIPTETAADDSIVGWKGEDGKEYNLETMPDYAGRLDAVIVAKQYTLHFSANNGTSNTTSVSYDAIEGTMPACPSDWKKTGYTFVGWMTEAAGASADYASGSTQTISMVASAAGEDLTLYACWTANQYAVAYYKDSSAAEASDSQSLFYDQEGTLNYSVSREHYTFSGWATEPNGSVVYQNGDQIKNLTDTANGTVKLYGIWTPVSYGIAIELYGGSFANGVAANESYTIEAGDYTLPVPSKSGYTFAGWTGSNGETPQTTVTIKQGTGGNLSYRANWTANTYKITYDANGGSLQCDRVQEVAYNTAPAAVADPVRTGYQFVRWENLPSLMPAEDVTASAVWQIEQYGLTVDTKGGGFAEGTEIPDNYTVETETFTLPVPLRTGYAFTGWTGTDLTETTETVSISKGSVGDRTYVAQWQAKTYDVTFYMEHETDAAVYWTQSAAFDSIIPFPDAPAKSGYTFKGWTTADGTSVPVGTTLITEGLELYADWNINVVQVKLDAGNDVAYGDYRLEYGGRYPTLPVPERDGYRFMGWFYGDTEIRSGDTVVCTEESQTLVAKWKQYYTVTLNWNYAGTTADTEPAYDGQVYHVDENTQREEYTREGYAFIGWFTEREGGTQVNGENPYEIEGDLALYAHWEATQYTISYSYDDDVAMPAGIAAGYSDLMLPLVLPVPEKTGYEFTGWQAGTQTPIFEIPEGTYGDCSYYATWRVKQYKVTYEAGTGSFADGTRIKEAQFAYGTELTEPDDLTRKGYQHIGWAPALPEKMPASDLKVTAQWKAAQYVVTLDYCDDSTEASTIIATYHETYGNLPTPNRKGYTFVGWFTAKAGGSQITENTVVECTENITLYARYEQVEGDYSVVNEYLTKIEKAGDLSVYSDESVAAIQAAVEAVVFGLGSEDQDQIDQMAAALRKAWNNREFCRVTVTFAPCGGSCNEVTLEYRYGEPYANLPGATREGYTFQGWYTAEKGGTQVNENVLMKERTDHTLYAQWKWVGADYSDVYAALDRIPADLNTYSEETRNRLQNAVDAVEYGLGAEKQSNVDSWAEAINKAIAGLVKKTMTVRFDANGGQVSPASKTVSHGDTLLLPVPTRSGYAFTGWFNAKSGGREYTEQTAITDHITLYARWTFVSADYGAVNAAISQIPVNLGLYTKKSAAAVTEAKNAVKWGLSSAEQATVNEFATAIRRAVNGLVRTLPFVDVKEGAWFHDTISTLYYSGIVKGMSETTYAPELSTNRAQMAVLLHRICGEPEADGNNPFTDVPKGSYYYDAVCWAYEKGVIKGLTEITYGPEEPITREQFATMLYRLFGFPAVGGSLGSFPDGRAVSDWARAGVIWSVQMGIIRGDDTGRLSPTENATRAEVATMLLRYINLVS